MGDLLAKVRFKKCAPLSRDFGLFYNWWRKSQLSDLSFHAQDQTQEKDHKR